MISPLIKAKLFPGQQPAVPQQPKFARNPAASILVRGPQQPTAQPAANSTAYDQRSDGYENENGQWISNPHTYNPSQPGPTAADQQKSKALTPEERLAADMAAGQKYATDSKIGADGSMGRLNDERKAEVDELLAKQKAGLNGMTTDEMRAAKEQGISGINQQLATNMQAFGDIAAGNGIRGGSAAGLQMQALGDAQSASGELSRKLILDNMAQKNIALDRYGNTLQTQQGVGLGVQDSNNQSKNAEQLAAQLAARDYQSQLDSYRAGDKANDYTQQGIDLAKQQVKDTGDYMKASAAKPSDKPQGSGSTKELPGAANTRSAEVFNSKMNPEVAKKALAVNPDKYVNKDGTPMTPEQITEAARNDPEFAIDVLYDQYKANGVQGFSRSGIAKDYYRNVMGMTDEQAGQKAGTIICTQAYHMGLISKYEYDVACEYRKHLSMKEYKGYITWAAPVVARMRRDGEFAARIAPLISLMIESEMNVIGVTYHTSLKSKAVFWAVKAANHVAAFARSLHLKTASRLQYA